MWRRSNNESLIISVLPKIATSRLLFSQLSMRPLAVQANSTRRSTSLFQLGTLLEGVTYRFAEKALEGIDLDDLGIRTYALRTFMGVSQEFGLC